ncbi:hypothetical protein BRC19_02840 [Candidatus Saccharibacteria bacterium QS_5_54_17]|nr:MAG: hypothetical protein BRC19_02840 [Candidatus Saccharibacteria bacterium QS_5_54_17]
MTHKTLRPPTQDNDQVHSYVKAVQKGLRSYLVIENRCGWYVRQGKNSGKLFQTKDGALEFARQHAASEESEVLIFNQKGELLQRQAPAR